MFSELSEVFRLPCALELIGRQACLPACARVSEVRVCRSDKGTSILCTVARESTGPVRKTTAWPAQGKQLCLSEHALDFTGYWA